MCMQGYMTVAEAAEYLKVHVQTIRRWIAEGKLKSYKGERIVRVKREDLDRLLTEN